MGVWPSAVTSVHQVGAGVNVCSTRPFSDNVNPFLLLFILGLDGGRPYVGYDRRTGGPPCHHPAAEPPALPTRRTRPVRSCQSIYGNLPLSSFLFSFFLYSYCGTFDPFSICSMCVLICFLFCAYVGMREIPRVQRDCSVTIIRLTADEIHNRSMGREWCEGGICGHAGHWH